MAKKVKKTKRQSKSSRLSKKTARPKIRRKKVHRKQNVSQLKLKAQRIKEIRDDYSRRISQLAVKQNAIIEEFLDKLRQKKIEELKSKI